MLILLYLFVSTLFETMSHFLSLPRLELCNPGLASNLWQTSCLSFPDVGLLGMRHHTQLGAYF